MTTSNDFNPAQVFRDDALFCRAFLRIQDKKRRIVPLRLNRVQAHYLAHRTQFDIILKPRQVGFSTLIQALLFKAVTTSSAVTLTMAHTHNTTQMLRRLSDHFYEHLPTLFRPRREYANTALATYPEFGSECLIATAGGRAVGRGATITHLHASELAYWKDARTALTAALQSLVPGGYAVVESTPNGASGHFYEMCMEALRGAGIWKLHFYPWWWSDDYVKSFPPDFTPSEEERRLMDMHQLTLGQMAWRREKIAQMGERLFMQEYPEDVSSCFLASGVTVFGDLSSVLYDEADELMDEQRVMGVDWGQAADATAISIMGVSGREYHIERLLRMPWAAMRARVIELARRWGVTRVVAEKNSIGAVNIEALRDEAAASGIAFDIVAFEMTQLRKAHLVARMIEAIQTSSIRLLRDPIATSEFMSYQTAQTANGLWSYSHPAGGHDDTVDARMLALWGATNM
jgi:hypothetical protein